MIQQSLSNLDFVFIAEEKEKMKNENKKKKNSISQTEAHESCISWNFQICVCGSFG